MVRLRTSRPRLSVPRRCGPNGFGGCSRSRKAWAAGPYGESPSAPIAPSATSRMTAKPISAVSGGGRLRRFRSTASWAFWRGAVWAPSADSAAKADPRIESGIQQIDHDVDDDHPGRSDGHERLNDRHVARGDGFDGQPAHTGVGEDALDHHRVTQDEHDLQRQETQKWQGGV